MNIQHQQLIARPAQEVWAHVSDFQHYDWLKPLIVSTHTEGRGQGMLLYTSDGGQFKPDVFRLDNIDDSAMEFHLIAVESYFFNDQVSEITLHCRVAELDDRNSTVDLTWTFSEPDSASADDMNFVVHQWSQMALTLLDKYLSEPPVA